MKEVMISLRFIHGINQLALPNFNLSFLHMGFLKREEPLFFYKLPADLRSRCFALAQEVRGASSPLKRLRGLPFPLLLQDIENPPRISPRTKKTR